jgi:hypothetical protein
VLLAVACFLDHLADDQPSFEREGDITNEERLR